MTVEEALDQVLSDLEKMSDAEFRAEMEKHKDGDIAVAMRELSAFASWMTMKEQGVMKDVTKVVESLCSTCGKSWDLHEFGVPAPYCP
jgi:hypothetical protein